MKKYYKLYRNKETYDIRLILMNSKDVHYNNAIELCEGNKIVNFNQNYIFCMNRTLLKELGRQFKQEWIDELNEKYSQIDNINI